MHYICCCCCLRLRRLLLRVLFDILVFFSLTFSATFFHCAFNVSLYHNVLRMGGRRSGEVKRKDQGEVELQDQGEDQGEVQKKNH